MPKKKTPNKVQISMRFPPDILAGIQRKAEKERRSLAACVVVMVADQMAKEESSK
mgnify:CR=1 FL=1